MADKTGAEIGYNLVGYTRSPGRVEDAALCVAACRVSFLHTDTRAQPPRNVWETSPGVKRYVFQGRVGVFQVTRIRGKLL